MIDVSAAVLKSANLTYGGMDHQDVTLKQWAERKNWVLGSTDIKESEVGFRQVPLATGVYQDLKLAVANVSELERAIENSKKAAVDFNQLSPLERYDLLLKVSSLITAKKELLSLAVSVSVARPARYSLQYEVETSERAWSFAAQQILGQRKVGKGDGRLLIVDSHLPLADACRIITLEIVKGNGVIVVPTAEVALPLFVLVDVLTEAGLKGLVDVVYSEKASLLAVADSCGVSAIGDFSLANDLRKHFRHLDFELNGKTALVAMETCDIDAVVDAAISSLHNHSHPTVAAGGYALVHDSLLKNFEWRLRDRLARSRLAAVFDPSADFISVEVTDDKTLKGTQSEVVKVGAAGVLFGAQPSLPITQSPRTGPLLLVMSYRSANELSSLLASLPFISEVSLWTEAQSVAWQIVQTVNIKRVNVNSIGSVEPGSETRIVVNNGLCPESAKGSISNAGIAAAIDAARNAQRSWQNAVNKTSAVLSLIRKLAADDLLKSSAETIQDLIPAGKSGIVSKAVVKNVVSLELETASGVVAVVAGEEAQFSQILTLLVRAVSQGCAVVYVVPAAVDAQVQHFLKLSGASGIPAGLFCKAALKDIPDILSHHSVSTVVAVGSSVKLPSVRNDGYQIQSLWQLKDQEDVKRVFVRSKFVSLAYGDGLGN